MLAVKNNVFVYGFKPIWVVVLSDDVCNVVNSCTDWPLKLEWDITNV